MRNFALALAFLALTPQISLAAEPGPRQAVPYYFIFYHKLIKNTERRIESVERMRDHYDRRSLPGLSQTASVLIMNAKDVFHSTYNLKDILQTYSFAPPESFKPDFFVFFKQRMKAISKVIRKAKNRLNKELDSIKQSQSQDRDMISQLTGLIENIELLEIENEQLKKDFGL